MMGGATDDHGTHLAPMMDLCPAIIFTVPTLIAGLAPSLGIIPARDPGNVSPLYAVQLHADTEMLAKSQHGETFFKNIFARDPSLKSLFTFDESSSGTGTSMQKHGSNVLRMIGNAAAMTHDVVKTKALLNSLG